MNATDFPETLATTYKTIQWHKHKNHSLYFNCHKNLKSE